jgi:hypothetical protein
MEKATVPNNPSQIQSLGTNRTSATISETPRKFNLQVVPNQLLGMMEVAAADPGIQRRFNLPGITDQPSLPPTARDIVPEEYHDYLHVCEGKENPGLPLHRYHDHQILLLEGKVPPFKPLQVLDEGRLQVLREYLETSLEQGWIRSSTSPVGAPIHFIKKKDVSLRLCVDYRGLNAITVRDRTLLPLSGEALDWLANAKIHTKLDVKDAYHNLRIAEGDEWKTAFQMKYSLYEYLVMPFRLTNALASFQWWMNKVLSDYLDIFCITYLNNILIYSDKLEQHCQHVRRILERVEEVGLMLKALKCEFHTDRIEYLGYIISPMGISMDLEKVRAMAE